MELSRPRRMTMMRVAIALVMLVVVTSGAMAQAPPGTSAPTWTGSVRCDIGINGPGYVSHETHTWTLSGAVPADGGVLDYPGTWTVTGDGSGNPTSTLRGGTCGPITMTWTNTFQSAGAHTVKA